MDDDSLPTIDATSNTFNNDGSFLEKFKEMQKTKQENVEEKKPSSSVKLPPLLTPGKKILTKRKGFLPQPVKNEHLPDLKKSKVSLIEATPTSLQSSSTTLPTLQTTPLATETATPTPKRKRKSRWGEAPSKEDQQMAMAMSSFSRPINSMEQQHQLLEQQEMNKLVQQVQSAAAQRRGGGKGGAHAEDRAMEAWQKEHSLRALEMEKTVEQAGELTEAAKGKHFIGDFLPPDELAKFMERVKAIKEGRNPDVSDYAEHKLTDDNVGYKLLQKAGWQEGAGLGKEAAGITTPINKGKQTFDQGGLGVNPVGEVDKEDNQFDVYRKRMMLAYKFRPNPLNNPRRPYY